MDINTIKSFVEKHKELILKAERDLWAIPEHGNDFYICDPIKACVNATVLEFSLIRRLLENDAAKAKEIIANYTPVFPNIGEYVAFKRSQTSERQTVIQNADASITIL